MFDFTCKTPSEVPCGPKIVIVFLLSENMQCRQCKKNNAVACVFSLEQLFSPLLFLLFFLVKHFLINQNIPTNNKLFFFFFFFFLLFFFFFVIGRKTPSYFLFFFVCLFLSFFLCFSFLLSFLPSSLPSFLPSYPTLYLDRTLNSNELTNSSFPL